jgi:hypothetical protein
MRPGAKRESLCGSGLSVRNGGRCCRLWPRDAESLGGSCLSQRDRSDPKGRRSVCHGAGSPSSQRPYSSITQSSRPPQRPMARSGRVRARQTSEPFCCDHSQFSLGSPGHWVRAAEECGHSPRRPDNRRAPRRKPLRVSCKNRIRPSISIGFIIAAELGQTSLASRARASSLLIRNGNRDICAQTLGR